MWFITVLFEARALCCKWLLDCRHRVTLLDIVHAGKCTISGLLLLQWPTYRPQDDPGEHNQEVWWIFWVNVLPDFFGTRINKPHWSPKTWLGWWRRLLVGIHGICCNYDNLVSSSRYSKEKLHWRLTNTQSICLDCYMQPGGHMLWTVHGGTGLPCSIIFDGKCPMNTKDVEMCTQNMPGMRYWIEEGTCSVMSFQLLVTGCIPLNPFG